MIDSLRGEIVERTTDHAVVECGGVGYLVQITPDTLGRLPAKGVCRLYVHYTVSVDVRSGQSEHRLYGFLHTEERSLFRQLITVQGVSATIGLSLCGAMRLDDLHTAIITGNASALRTVKGIGPKLAARIIQELSEKLAASPIELHSGTATPGGNTAKAEALSALISLGLDRAKAEIALSKVIKAHKDDPPGVEELIKLALKNR